MATATGDIEAILAKTALKYDQLPYESKPFPQSQPARLAALARMFGLEAAPIETARVLELGCASGGNIIPHAARYPDACFVGVDIGRAQVTAGHARIEQLGLSNIDILCQSFTEIGEELGDFDYIVCHGVYSWVPPEVQEAILRVIRSRLSPSGIGCVSYNVLPGWRMMQPIRDALLMATTESANLLARTARAREILSFMAANTTDKGPYGESLRVWNERLSALPDDYLCHEFLEDCNEPTMLSRFAADANRHGLGYLGDCEFAAMIADNYGAELARQVRALGGNDLVANEQLLDILSGRTFRQSVLVARERMAAVNRALSPDCITGLHLVLAARGKLESNGEETALALPDGRRIATTNAAVAAALERICASQPASVAVDEMLGRVTAEDRMNVADALYSMVVSGIAQAQDRAAGCVTEAGDMPRASNLARGDARSGLSGTTNLRHEFVLLDAAAQAVLPFLDGSASHADLVDRLAAAALAGQLAYARDGKAITEADEINETAAELLPGLLAGIAAAGLLEG